MTTQTGSIVTLANLDYALPNDGGAIDINNAGQVVGSSDGLSGSVAATWLGSAVTALPTVSGYSYSDALAINESGQIVGYVGTDRFNPSHAVIWQNGVATYVGNPAYYSQADGINDQGQVVGVAGPIGQVDRAFVWQNGTMTYLPNLPGVTNTNSGSYDALAIAINNSGQIVGFALTPSNTDHAVLWQNGAVTDLGTLPGGTFSDALAINASGQIAGYSRSSGGTADLDTAFLWQNGVMTALAPPTGYDESDAHGINDAGLIVGSATLSTGPSGQNSIAILWKNGNAIDLNSLLSDSYLGNRLTSAAAINDMDQIVVSDGSAYYVLTLGSGTTGLTAASATQSFASGKIAGQVPVLDSGANVQADLDGLQNMAAVGLIGSITLTDQSMPTLTLTAARFEHDAAALADIQGTFTITVQGPVTATSIAAAYGPQYASISHSEFGPHLTAVTIVDSAANVSANIYNIEALAEAQSLSAITLTDSGAPTLTLDGELLSQFSKALAAISGPYQIDATDVAAADAATILTLPNVIAVSVSDEGFDIGGNLAALQKLAAAGQLLSINLLSDGGAANGDNIDAIYVTPTQLASDGTAIAKIIGTYDVYITAPATGQTITGLAGHANAVSFPNIASQYTLSSSADGQSLIVTDGSATYQLDDIEALQFSGGNFLIVAQTPGDAAHVTTGNITELYSAVFAREPDLAGLSFYQTYLAANPNTPLELFAQWFLASTEYSGNPAHDYAQTAAGETQFITDSYQNLLHRTPSSDEVNFYLIKVIQPALTGLAGGTTAYNNADAQAHALMLVYFSASSEFLAGVQVTAANQASAQHWLVLT